MGLLDKFRKSTTPPAGASSFEDTMREATGERPMTRQEAEAELKRRERAKQLGNTENVKTRRQQESEALKEMKAYKKGGKVKKTGPAKLHKGERVLTVKQAKSPVVKKALKKAVSSSRKK